MSISSIIPSIMLNIIVCFAQSKYPAHFFTQPHLILKVQLTEDGLNFATEGVGDLLKAKLPEIVFPKQTFTVGGYDIALVKVRVDRFIMPRAQFTAEPSSLRIEAIGGQIAVSASWCAINICTGTVSVSTTGFDVLSLEIAPSNNSMVSVPKCQVNVPFNLDIRGSIGWAINGLTILLQRIFKEQTSKLLCAAIGDSVEAIFKQPPINITDYYKLKYSLAQFEVTNEDIFAKLYATFIPKEVTYV